MTAFNNDYPKPEYPGVNLFEHTTGILAGWEVGCCRARAE